MTADRLTRAMAELGERRILVVEDEYFIADDLCRALQKHGAWVVGPVSDLAGGLDLVAREQIDGAVLDVNLGGLMSYPIAERLGELGVPFLFTTGYDEGTLTANYSHITRIEKPFETSLVMAALAKLIRGAARQEAIS